MPADRGRSDADACFVCGPENPIGLHITFRLENGICRAEFTPQPNHQGYDGVTHGGIIFSLLDDVMANCLFLQGIRAYTAKCTIRFRDPIPVGTSLVLEGHEVRRKGRFVILEGRVLRAESGEVAAEAESTFLLLSESEESP